MNDLCKCSLKDFLSQVSSKTVSVDRRKSMAVMSFDLTLVDIYEAKRIMERVLGRRLHSLKIAWKIPWDSALQEKEEYFHSGVTDARKVTKGDTKREVQCTAVQLYDSWIGCRNLRGRFTKMRSYFHISTCTLLYSCTPIFVYCCSS